MNNETKTKIPNWSEIIRIFPNRFISTHRVAFKSDSNIRHTAVGLRKANNFFFFLENHFLDNFLFNRSHTLRILVCVPFLKVDCNLILGALNRRIERNKWNGY